MTSCNFLERRHWRPRLKTSPLKRNQETKTANPEWSGYKIKTPFSRVDANNKLLEHTLLSRCQHRQQPLEHET
ncbi:hypothetical protein DPMN_178758 [Dreissena polymorpha]|uniref:Uncharacterized protein n=1 Tax=Dreissena polymorpha TaxID=45954 RepID=A0A9D4IMX1_DREPO|nr:hypothetical protein DPMN_178758 [Dreissena polymorpha]